jgi:CRISPR-associated protein Csd1
MILQALADYYVRKTAEPGSGLAPPGFETKEIPFILALAEDGRLLEIEDTRRLEGKKPVARAWLVPQGVKKTSGVAANLLWDTAEYVLGVDTRDRPERVAEQHRAFAARIEQDLAGVDDPGLAAVRRFLDTLDLAGLERFPQWPDIRDGNPNLSFRLAGRPELVCQRPAVVEAVSRPPADAPAARVCAVSGRREPVERLHPAIKGVWGAQTSGANIVSFNLDAFSSFGKSQGDNAPVGQQAAFAYTTALNHLLGRDSRQRIQVGDASTVFWSDRRSPFEESFPGFFAEPEKDDPDRHTDKVRGLLEAVRTGAYCEDRDPTRFFVLGLAPNAARIAVRFWQADTVAVIAERIARHFQDMEMVPSHHGESPYPSLFRLLVSIAAQGKADNIPPNLGGELMRAIIGGGAYPATLWQAAVRRNRAEQQVSYYRAALLKGCFNRLHRTNPFLEKEIAVSLDKTNPNAGYRLGRLFATLEKIQQEAQGSLNATIRDRFYGAASANPLSVFSNLMKLKNHHLSKMDNRGRVANLEKLIGEILDGVSEFPPQLPLRDQGLFAIGYYHQRQDFFRKAETKE